MSSDIIPNDTASQRQTLRVELGERSYSIMIGQGLLGEAGAFVQSLRPGAKCAIVTDENVAQHHLEPLEKSLSRSGVAHHAIVLPPGEGTKSFQALNGLLDKLLEAEIERGDLIIALGGGVIGDLVGFAASVLRRGVDFVQIPTSLLAQVDSSVGGKTGINSRFGKNLIGAFHQPLLVLCDLDTLATLEDRQFRAGYAEVVKYGLIRDAGFFKWLEQNQTQLFQLETAALAKAVHTSCAMKADVVSRDEKEHGVRALLNLGHTFGHAFEALTGYSEKLLHGESIAIGMVMAFDFSIRLGHAPAGLDQTVANHFKKAGLPTCLADIPSLKAVEAGAIGDKMRQDKKVERGQMVFILARQIGDAFVARDVSHNALEDFLSESVYIS